MILLFSTSLDNACLSCLKIVIRPFCPILCVLKRIIAVTEMILLNTDNVRVWFGYRRHIVYQSSLISFQLHSEV